MKIVFNNKFKLIASILLLNFTTAFGQVPTPASSQSGPILLMNGTAHIGNGEVIENAAIGFENGKITLVADATNARIDMSQYNVVDIAGQHVYPGFILPGSQVGLEEVGAIRAQSDSQEEGDVNPNVRAQIAYNTDSKYPPVFRFNGILVGEATPRGGLVSGTSSAMNFDGWNWEDATLKADIGIHLNWPSIITRRFDFNTFTRVVEKNKNYDNTIQVLESTFDDAYSYGQLPQKTENLKMDAMQGLYDGSKVLFIHANGPKEIIDAVNFAKRNNVRKIVVYADDAALMVADFLKENKIPVIIPPTQRDPQYDHSDYDSSYRLPHNLTEAGVEVSIAIGLFSARNLPFLAGAAAGHGMDKEDALKTITLNTAKALGIDDMVGSLEEGKDATLFVSKGDALDMIGNNLSHAFIQGKAVELNGEQQMLYKRYSEKYGHDTGE